MITIPEAEKKICNLAASHPHFNFIDVLELLHHLAAENERLKQALEQICTINVSSTTDANGMRDQNRRFQMGDIAALALRPQAEALKEKE